MENRKLNKNISKIDFDSINIDKYVESDIDEYIKYFNIDEESKNKIIIPTDLKKNVKEPFKEVKREKRKTQRISFRTKQNSPITMMRRPSRSALTPTSWDCPMPSR